MRYYELVEKRKLPDLNPKISINARIIDRLDKTTDSINGVKNLWVSFTDVPKLGVNPGSIYEGTPIGIYAYPAEYLIERVGSTKSFVKVPFGRKPWVNMFNVSGNILHLNTLSASDTTEYYNKLAELWASVYGLGTQAAKIEIKKIFDTTKKSYTGTPKVFWNTTKLAADHLRKPWDTSIQVAWRKIFETIGINGILETTPNSDPETNRENSIIHHIEPTQAVFFNAKISNIDRYPNKYSPESIEKGKKEGESYKRFSNMTTAQLLDYFKKSPGSDIQYIRNPSTRIEILSHYPKLIKFSRKPTEQEQVTAILADPDTLAHILTHVNDNVLKTVLEKSKFNSEVLDAIDLWVTDLSPEIQKLIN